MLFVRWSTGPDTDRETQARKNSCSSCTPMIVARGEFVWFSAGYEKSSCYQLLAFVYDSKLKQTRSCGTKRNVVFVLSLLLTVFLLQMRPVHAHW